MTTIAFKDGIIAYDSQLTQDFIIKSKDFDKHIEKDGVHFFIAGPPGDYHFLIDSWFAGCRVAPDNEIPECGGFVVDAEGVVWDCGFNKDNIFWRSKQVHEDACGSGAAFALAAMDMGADAETAVRIAAGRDVYTGGKIRTFKVHAS